MLATTHWIFLLFYYEIWVSKGPNHKKIIKSDGQQWCLTTTADGTGNGGRYQQTKEDGNIIQLRQRQMTPFTKKNGHCQEVWRPRGGKMTLGLSHHHCLTLLKICQKYLLLFTDITLYCCCMPLLTVSTIRGCWQPSLPNTIICPCKVTINQWYCILQLLYITSVRWCCCLVYTIADFHCLPSYLSNVVVWCHLMMLTAIHQCRSGGIWQENDVVQIMPTTKMTLNYISWQRHLYHYSTFLFILII